MGDFFFIPNIEFSILILLNELQTFLLIKKKVIPTFIYSDGG